MRLFISTCLTMATALGLAGCRMCQGPEDYTGPVIRDGLPTLNFCERHNSLLSPGTFSTRVKPIADERVESTDGVVAEEVWPAERMRPRTETPLQKAPLEPQRGTQPRLEPTPAAPPSAPPSSPRTTRGWVPKQANRDNHNPQ